MGIENSKHRLIRIPHEGQRPPSADILIIYTGGTFGMVHDESGALVAFDFQKIQEKVPSLKSLDICITVISFTKPLDSSNIGIPEWQEIAEIIAVHYDRYDGFVLLHGTDTMTYTASALSFMLVGLNKPVIITGAQLPISAIRSDARSNLVTALEIAAAKEDGHAVVPEVCIYFDYRLTRGNRTYKRKSNQFEAYGCDNYPVLATAGISIVYNRPAIRAFDPHARLVLKKTFDTGVFVLRITPSLSERFVRQVIQMDGLRGLILETYGSGNAPTAAWFLDLLRKAVDKGIILYNVSQLVGGVVIQGRYETSKYLSEMGVISGSDITIEAAWVKFMFLLGTEKEEKMVRKKLAESICGEMTT
jgi:L-asparaginase